MKPRGFSDKVSERTAPNPRHGIFESLDLAAPHPVPSIFFSPTPSLLSVLRTSGARPEPEVPGSEGVGPKKSKKKRGENWKPKLAGWW